MKVSIVGSLRDREVACSASETARARISNPVSGGQCHLKDFILAQFSLHVHKGGLKPDSFHLYYRRILRLHGSILFSSADRPYGASRLDHGELFRCVIDVN